MTSILQIMQLLGGRLKRKIHPRFATALALLITTIAFPTPAAEMQATGIVLPFIDVTLSAPVPGIIMSRKFDEGASVKPGDVLLELDNQLERLEVERRKVVLDQKRSDFEGTKKLFNATKGVSKEELDRSEAEFRVAAVEFDIAVEQLKRRQLVAPHAGVISQMLLEVGESCAAYQSLIQVVDTSKCFLVTSMEASQAARLKKDQELRLEIDNGGEKAAVNGKVFFISPVVDPASGLQRVKIIFDNKDGKVRPGLTGVALP
jgi:RND family efflux transporter MFP subunit